MKHQEKFYITKGEALKITEVWGPLERWRLGLSGGGLAGQRCCLALRKFVAIMVVDGRRCSSKGVTPLPERRASKGDGFAERRRLQIVDVVDRSVQGWLID